MRCELRDEGRRPDPRARLTHHVAVMRQSLARGLVILGRHVLHASRVAPAVVEIEQRTDGNGIEYGLIGPPGAPHLVGVGGGQFIGAMVHFLDEGKKSFLLVPQARAAEIPDDALN